MHISYVNFSSSASSTKDTHACETWSTTLAQIAYASYIFFIDSGVSLLHSSKDSGGVLGLICTSNSATFFRRSSVISPSRMTLASKNIFSIIPSSAKFVHARATSLLSLCLFSSYIFVFCSASCHDSSY